MKSLTSILNKEPPISNGRPDRQWRIKQMGCFLLNSLSFPKSSTNVEEVKRLNAQSGLSYNQVFELLAEKYKQETAQKHKTSTF